jgi:hypothetical protein
MQPAVKGGKVETGMSSPNMDMREELRVRCFGVASAWLVLTVGQPYAFNLHMIGSKVRLVGQASH